MAAEGILNNNSNSEIQHGENNLEAEQLMSYEICKYKNTDIGFCKYRDIDDRCIFETCVFDGDELPKATVKMFTTCIICGKEFERDPRFMKAYICDSCLQRMLKAEKLPFTCICCGKQQNTPSLLMFSRICDYCVNHRLFNTTCRNFKYTKTGIDGEENEEPLTEEDDL